MNSTLLKTTNPFIIIKNWIRRKIALFIYPEIKKLHDLSFTEMWKRFEGRYGKIDL